MEPQETFFTLLHNAAHWEFELFLMLVFDGLIGFIVWPCFRRAILHHQSDDQKIRDLRKQVKEMRVVLGLEDE